MSLVITRHLLEQNFVEQRKQLCAISYKLLGNAAQAEEVMQEAFLRLLDVAIGKQVDCLQAYCCQVVRNLSLDNMRRLQVEGQYRVYTDDGELPQTDGGENPQRLLQQRQLLQAIDAAMETLPERTRRAFELYRIHGMTQRDIAKELSCSATLVNFMLRDVGQALAGCREHL
ncbi:RNA polymerase sigma-70 factor (ECF subfamily) [Chitinivorax tropicus]|uniref:RNA polymerase sigma-70 factor (ECF subfamily) n=1 Tax=Chitinivorax tropicus TaxID=714531 RepID=A0A840MSI4_9PROT|nr:sigma-70 family RNA polymerase sigma factor [Chitinivorax tropicus]MBB5020375.1 RNA polymerase sigma-70 factor (ECF subfamily) [Chitinivorax tropicus]